MNKPNIPADLMPSVLLCYESDTLALEVKDLIDRCATIRLSSDWQRIDQLALDVDRLVLSGIDKRDHAIALVHLGDICWQADRLESAQRSYSRARDMFELLSDLEQRYNQAMAAYGLGLIYHTMGSSSEAQGWYNQALGLLQQLRTYWGWRDNERFRRCVTTSEQIERVKQLSRDIPYAPVTTEQDRTRKVGEEAKAPTILGTVPANAAQNVPIDTVIVIAFSKPMETASFKLTIEPNGNLGDMPPAEWWENDTIAISRLPHGTFDYCTTYRVKITGVRDKDGNPPKDGYAPQSWSFKTQNTDDPAPRVVDFVGCKGRIPGNAPLAIVFNKPIVPDSIPKPSDYPVQLIEPNPGDIKLTWDKNQKVFAIEHHTYPTLAGAAPPKITVTGAQDSSGTPLVGTDSNQFDPGLPIPDATQAPQILDCWPGDGSIDVPVDTPLVILFSKPMEKVSVTVNPQPAFLEQWLHPSGRVLVLRHSNLFFAQDYQVEVEGKDTNSHLIVAGSKPAKWQFRTRVQLPPAVPIIGVAPVDGATGVPVTVNPVVVFGQSMSTDPADFDWTPKSVSYTARWDVDPLHQVVIIHPDPPLEHEKNHTWQISQACDTLKHNLMSASPFTWSFRTEKALPAAPVVESRKPSRDLLNVAVDQVIQVTFSEPMEETGFEYEILPKPDHDAPQWDASRQTVEIHHTNFKFSETYTITVKQARAQNGLALSAPVSWSFTTAPRPEAPVIRSTYPYPNDMDVPLRIPVLITFSQPVDVALLVIGFRVAGKLLQVCRPTKWDPDRTIVEFAPGLLTADTEYTINVTGVTLGHDKFASTPNPWGFRTTARTLTRQNGAHQDVLIRDIAIGLLVVDLALCVVGAVLLLLWQGWLAAVVYAMVLIACPFLVARWARGRHLLFALSHDEEAVVEENEQLKPIQGPRRWAWRTPFTGKLRAIIPTRPLDFQVTDCSITNDDQEQIDLVTDVQYRVFDSLHAFRFLREADEEKKADSTIYTDKELRAALEKELCRTTTQAASDRLHKMTINDIQRRRNEIEEELRETLSLKACRWGIEIQDLQIREIRTGTANP